MSIMAFIPARGGSKGIPGKNLYPLAGKPLIGYTLEAALGCTGVDSVFLSSDAPDIIAYCRSLGLDVGYQRPAEIAGDSAQVSDALLHALAWLNDQGEPLPEHVLLLQPTSPLRTAQDIELSIQQYLARNSNSLVSVHAMNEHPFECVTGASGDWKYLCKPSTAACRRQDYCGSYYFVNGAIYIVRTAYFLQTKSFIEEDKSELYVMPAARGVDIDTMYDMLLAEFTLKNMPTAGGGR